KALPLAEKAVALSPERWMHVNTLGVVYYRLGRHEPAMEMLERSLRASKGETAAFDLFFLPMCHARRGKDLKPQHCYHQARKWVKERQGKLPAQWAAELKAFRSEAEAELAKQPAGSK